MPDTPSLTTIKLFTYRDAPEEWSNTYHFSGTTPADAAAWKVFADAVIALEKTVITTNTKIVRAYGYEAGNDTSVWSNNYLGPPDLSVAGTLAYSEATAAPGDAAATIRWWTGTYTSPGGKKIYCRKYFHDCQQSASDHDELLAAQKTAMTSFAASMIDGTLPAGRKYCGPQGAVLSAPSVNPYITTRTLKRRGKRPPT